MAWPGGPCHPVFSRALGNTPGAPNKEARRLGIHKVACNTPPNPKHKLTNFQKNKVPINQNSKKTKFQKTNKQKFQKTKKPKNQCFLIDKFQTLNSNNPKKQRLGQHYFAALMPTPLHIFEWRRCHLPSIINCESLLPSPLHILEWRGGAIVVSHMCVLKPLF
jgi:hypothetical protein